MQPSLLLLGMIASLAFGGSSGTVPTKPETPLAAAGELVFPSVGGFQATAHYTLLSVPRGAAAELKSQMGGAGLPRPFGSGPVVVAFTMTVTQPVQMPQLPTWQITAPSQTAANELALEVCPGSHCTIWENSHGNGKTISVTGTGLASPAPTLSLSPGIVYVFELVLPPAPPHRSAAPSTLLHSQRHAAGTIRFGLSALQASILET
jgi:hypothetical protein